MTKVILVVLDSVGIGELPDACSFGDTGSNTLGNIADAVDGLKLPNLARLGLGKIIPVRGLPDDLPVQGSYGRMAELSIGKDTTAGHWEIAGIITKEAMPTFPHGFPDQFIAEFERAINRKVLGNKAASGTEIIVELGEEHAKTGYPIVYTSADSVFQIAAHEEVIPLNELYEICKTARKMLTGKLAVGRVIARPFIGTPGSYTRTANRHDFSMQPPEPTVLNALQDNGREVIGVGKIKDIFAGTGITQSFPTTCNREGVQKTIQAWKSLSDGLIFANLVDFDSICGHRNDTVSYAKMLEEFDRFLPRLTKLVKDEGLLIITADHGNDPTTKSTDHSREYVPLLVYGGKVRAGADLGDRKTFADIAATISELFGLSYACAGESFLHEIMNKA